MDFSTTTADELIARQYADRSHLRAVYDAIINAATECGEIVRAVKNLQLNRGACLLEAFNFWLWRY